MSKKIVGTIIQNGFIAAILLLCAVPSKAQTVSPLGGVGSLQMFNDDGSVLTTGMVYVFQSGTSTTVAVYSDSTGTTQQPNPVPLGGNGRGQIWLANNTTVKVVLCSSNTDGAFCAAGHILFSVDNVPIGSSSSGTGSSPFTGIFISSTASPATSGILRLASGDSTCWRNAAGSANLCWSKDSNDLLSWAGGSLKLPEVGTPTGVAAFDILWADNTAHRLKAANNGGIAAQYVLSGNDVDTTDAVTKWHFGATQVPLSSTAPTTGQFLQFNGTNIVGVTSTGAEVSIGCTTTSLLNATSTENAAGCPPIFLPAAHTLIRLGFRTTNSGAGCTGAAIIAFKDVTGGTNVSTLTLAVNPLVGNTDSGALTLGLTAAREFALIISTAAVGCTTVPQGKMWAVYQ